MIDIYMFGSLQQKFNLQKNSPVHLEPKASTSILEILKELKIDPDSIQLTMLNYRAVSKDAAVFPGDRLSLFPPEYPIFADWNDFRFH